MLTKTNQNQRILFFKLFTRELLLAVKKNIQEKELKKPTEIEIKDEEKIEDAEELKEFQKSIFKPAILEKKPLHHYTVPISQPPANLRERIFKPRIIMPTVIPTAPRLTSKTIELPSQVNKESAEIDLGKLNMFLKDKAITMIECPGPEKPVLVKRINQLNITKISLSQQEINKIIEEFSKKARIPIMGGVLRINVNDLTISAVISDFVGSRFIITKASPYSLIEEKNKLLKQIESPQNFNQSRKNF